MKQRRVVVEQFDGLAVPKVLLSSEVFAALDDPVHDLDGELDVDQNRDQGNQELWLIKMHLLARDANVGQEVSPGKILTSFALSRLTRLCDLASAAAGRNIDLSYLRYRSSHLILSTPKDQRGLGKMP